MSSSLVSCRHLLVGGVSAGHPFANSYLTCDHEGHFAHENNKLSQKSSRIGKGEVAKALGNVEFSARTSFGKMEATARTECTVVIQSLGRSKDQLPQSFSFLRHNKHGNHLWSGNRWRKPLWGSLASSRCQGWSLNSLPVSATSQWIPD